MDMASSQPQTPFNMTLMASPTATNHSLFTNPVIYATLAVGLLSIYTISQPWSKSVNVPIVFSEIRNSQDRKRQYLTNPRNLLVKGYQTFGDRIWAIDTSQGLKLVLPISYLDELKSHPALSFLASINNDALVHYTGVGGLTDPVLQIFKAKFNPSLPSYTPVMHSEILQELPKIFPNTKQDEWVETPVYEKMLQLASILSTRAFYSAAASKDPAWLELVGAYISTAIEYVEALKRWPAITRSIIRFFLPQRALVVRYWDQARAHLSASLKAKASGVVNDPPSLFDHIVDASGGGVSVDDLIHTQMALVVAGIHTSAAALTQFLYDIAVHPESIEELREEAMRVRESVGGTFTKQSLAELKKLDSWMKESQRLSSADLTTFQRMSTAPLTLKSGFHIPRGTKLEIATAAIHADDAFLPNAASFDGLRYYNMRQCADHAVRHQYISTGKADLSWGYGRHACPGRFFADIEIKMVLAEFLIHSEVKNPEGQGRYANLEFEANIMPDPSKTVFVRSVKPW